jgi:hypothetical protein
VQARLLRFGIGLDAAPIYRRQSYMGPPAKQAEIVKRCRSPKSFSRCNPRQIGDGIDKPLTKKKRRR